MLKLISRLWRDKPYYLIKIVQESPYHESISYIQFDRDIPHSTALTVAENWRIKHYPNQSFFVCSRVSEEQIFIWECSVGKVIDCKNIIKDATHSNKRTVKKTIDYQGNRKNNVTT